MADIYEVFAIKYATRDDRTRADSFIFDDDHASPHSVDYFLWVIRNKARTIVVDTGFDSAEAQLRGRELLRDPLEGLLANGIDPEQVDDVIITHLHYDHAGCLNRFPKALFHVQTEEVAFATGPCMCHPTLRAPYTAEHVCEMVRKIYTGRVVFRDGAAEVVPGVEVHRTGGHSRGLQCVRVMTRRGPIVLASDASHYFENFMLNKPFPIVDQVADMLDGFATIRQLAGDDMRIIPGHDPLVTELYRGDGSGDPDCFALHINPHFDVVL